MHSISLLSGYVCIQKSQSENQDKLKKNLIPRNNFGILDCTLLTADWTQTRHVDTVS